MSFRMLSLNPEEDNHVSPKPSSDPNSDNNLIPYFKTENVDDYKRFRSLMQVLDLCVLDLDTYNFDKMQIVACSIYLEIGLFFKVFSRKQISLMPDISTLMISIEQQGLEFCHMMQHFIACFFNFDIAELIPTMQYVCRFFALETTTEYPLVI